MIILNLLFSFNTVLTFKLVGTVFRLEGMHNTLAGPHLLYYILLLVWSWV